MGSGNMTRFVFEKIPLPSGSMDGKHPGWPQKDPPRTWWQFRWEMMTIWTRMLVEGLVRNRQTEYIFDNEMFEPV